MHFIRKHVQRVLSVATLLACMQYAAAQNMWKPLGGANLTGWQGVVAQSDCALLGPTRPATYIFDRESQDFFDWYGIRFDVELTSDQATQLNVVLRTPAAAKEDGGVAAKVTIQGKGWHTVVLPWTQFDYAQPGNFFLHSIQEIAIAARAEGGKNTDVNLRDVRVIRGEHVWLGSDIQGKSAKAGEAAEYVLKVGNCTDKPQAVVLSQQVDGYEAMVTTLEPRSLLLQPGESREVKIKVEVPARIPAGGHEKQIITAIGNGRTSASGSITLVTASRMSNPYIIHTSEGWQQIRQNVEKYDWAKKSLAEYTALADKWKAPGVFQYPDTPRDKMRGKPLFNTATEYGFMACGIAYQVTGKADYAQKVRQFLLNLSDPETGFPVTQRACNQASVQEGHFFQHIAMAYDMALPSGVFTESDRKQIDQTLRLYAASGPGLGGNISNWSVSALCGGLYSALAIQDLSLANQLIYAKGGLIDQLVQGTLDDGWWHECSISYNVWCATEFTQMALAMRPWGVNLADATFPGAYRSSNDKPASQQLYGMTKAQWGPIYHNNMNIKRMWDALPPMLDYRGIMFGLNDSTERQVGGGAMDIAYYLYRDPAYANVIKRGDGKRDLLYAVPELPDNGLDMSTKSAFSDNAGVVVLRSQAANRTDRERIQAVLHYGDHGWFHGHFDRTDLVHLSRFGRSFYNPEFIWYGYGSHMYKFYVQTSVNKNMVVVDQKQQEPVESRRMLFYSGKRMQATAVETNARWSNPPYGGMTYDDQSANLAEKILAESRSFPIPDNAPKYGQVTGYTEPILQRRVMVVTDDYVVLADYLKGDQEHTYDSLFQMKGFQSLDAADKKLGKHTGQWTNDPLSSAQFVTDCDWYDLAAPARGSYEFHWGPGADNAGTHSEWNEPGVLKMDMHTLWPARQQIMIATPPETHDVQKVVSYTIRGDGKTLKEGKSGMWVLGAETLDVPLDGAKSLEIAIQAGTSKLPSLFLAGAKVVTADGKQVSLSSLPMTVDNVMQLKEAGKDFAGGPIKIAGIHYPEAVSVQPKDAKKVCTIKIDLGAISAARLTGVLGSDFPVGDESQRRKTVAQRIVGTQARFITVIEPYEDTRMVKSAKALSEDRIQVELADGRTQTIEISNLEGNGQDIGVKLTESKEGQIAATEKTGK